MRVLILPTPEGLLLNSSAQVSKEIIRCKGYRGALPWSLSERRSRCQF